MIAILVQRWRNTAVEQHHLLLLYYSYTTGVVTVASGVGVCAVSTTYVHASTHANQQPIGKKREEFVRRACVSRGTAQQF